MPFLVFLPVANKIFKFNYKFAERNSCTKKLPTAIILKQKSSLCTQTIAYETFEKEITVFVKQEFQGEEWKTVKHMALPVVTFNFIHCLRSKNISVKRAQYTLLFGTGYTRKFIFNSNVLVKDIRRSLHISDLQETPIYKNQEKN